MYLFVVKVLVKPVLLERLKPRISKLFAHGKKTVVSLLSMLYFNNMRLGLSVKNASHFVR
jgi:hypothetical protein